MIDQHREGLAKLDNALQVEKIRQEKDLKEFIFSKSPPAKPSLDISNVCLSSLNSTRQTSLPRPAFNSSNLRTSPSFDSELSPVPRELSPTKSNRPRSYSATPISPPSLLSPISPYKPPKDFVSPVTQLQATKRVPIRKVYKELARVGSFIYI
jgi:hypothetical protein